MIIPNDIQAEQRLFYDNAFLFLAHSERIMNDKRMSLTSVPIQSGLAYTGTSGFQNPTLGVYLEFWQNCHLATRIDGNGIKSLLCRIAGSPLTGSNKCDVVYEDGTVESVHLPCFRPVWHEFIETNKRHDEAKETGDRYSLKQVVEILAKEELTDYDKNAMDAFFYKRDADYWKNRCLSAENMCNSLRKDFRWSKMECKRTELTVLVDETNRLQAKADTLKEETRRLRRTMVRKLHAKEMTPAEYQRWWQTLPVRQEMDTVVENQRTLVHDTLKHLFPKDYMIISMGEVRDFVESLSNK